MTLLVIALAVIHPGNQHPGGAINIFVLNISISKTWDEFVSCSEDYAVMKAVEMAETHSSYPLGYQASFQGKIRLLTMVQGEGVWNGS